MPWSSKGSLSFWLSHQNPVHFSLHSHACHMSCHFILFDSENPSISEVLVNSFQHIQFCYSEGLLPSAQSPSWSATLLAVHNCLFNICTATLHIWRPSLLSATWGRTMPWWQGTHLKWTS
jgi:hypothetical protein